MTWQDRSTLDRIQQTLTRCGYITVDDGQWLIDQLKSVPDQTAGNLQNAEMPIDPRTRGRIGNS